MEKVMKLHLLLSRMPIMDLQLIIRNSACWPITHTLILSSSDDIALSCYVCISLTLILPPLHPPNLHVVLLQRCICDGIYMGFITNCQLTALILLNSNHFFFTKETKNHVFLK